MQMSDLKKDIILKAGVRHFDYTASALGLKSVECAVKKVLQSYANTHSDSALNSFATQKHYENARQSIKESLKLDENFALIACGSGASGAIKKFQELLGIYVSPKLKAKIADKFTLCELPLVVLSPFEHHSNELSFRQGLCECVRVGLDESKAMDFAEFERVLKKARKRDKNRQIIVSCTLASNVTGVLCDYTRLSAIARNYNALIAYDAATFTPYKSLPCELYDALFISPHKFLGGVGACGLLVVRKALCGTLPSFAAGGTVGYVSRNAAHFVRDIERLEEGGTPNILGLVRAGCAFAVKDAVGENFINAQEVALREFFFKKAECFAAAPLFLYASSQKNRLPIFALNVAGVSPFELAFVLSKHYKIETRAGCACAGYYAHELLGAADLDFGDDFGGESVDFTDFGKNFLADENFDFNGFCGECVKFTENSADFDFANSQKGANSSKNSQKFTNSSKNSQKGVNFCENSLNFKKNSRILSKNSQILEKNSQNLAKTSLENAHFMDFKKENLKDLINLKAFLAKNSQNFVNLSKNSRNLRQKNVENFAENSRFKGDLNKNLSLQEILGELSRLWQHKSKTRRIGFLRVSLHYTHDFSDIEYFFSALEKSIAKILRKKA